MKICENMIALILFFATFVQAKDIVVYPPYCFDIQTAIDSSASGDKIILKEGIYGSTPPSYFFKNPINFHGKKIELRSENPDDPSCVSRTVIENCVGILSCQSTFIFNNGENRNTIINGITMLSGWIGMQLNTGGIIDLTNSFPLIKNCIFVSHDNMFAIYNRGPSQAWYDAQLEINSCTFINACSIYGVSLIMKNCEFIIKDDLEYTNHYICLIPPTGDLNWDCRINILDFCIFAEKWLVNTRIE